MCVCVCVCVVLVERENTAQLAARRTNLRSLQTCIKGITRKHPLMLVEELPVEIPSSLQLPEESKVPIID